MLKGSSRVEGFIRSMTTSVVTVSVGLLRVDMMRGEATNA
jgi:hypothetical protein